jgi:hypothetical protein
MSKAFKTDSWLELGRELSLCADLPSRDLAALEQALNHDDPRMAAKGVRSVLLNKLVSETAKSRPHALSYGGTRKQQERAEQALQLIEHGLNSLNAMTGPVPQHLCDYLVDGLRRYGEALEGSSQADSKGRFRRVAERLLSGISRHIVHSEETRIGILKPSEVASFAAGTGTVERMKTVRGTGDHAQDLLRWKRARSSDAKIQEQLQSGSVKDGEYLLGVFRGGGSRTYLDLYPITQGKKISSQYVSRVQVDPGPSRMNAVTALLSSEALLSGSEGPALASPATFQSGGDDSKAVPFRGILASAVALNQARVTLYGEILRRRSDLKGAARTSSEQRLRRMSLETEVMAHSVDDPEGATFLMGRWRSEIQRDLSRLSQRMGLPSIDETYITQMGALSQLGAFYSKAGHLRGELSAHLPTGSRMLRRRQGRSVFRPSLSEPSAFAYARSTPFSRAERHDRRLVVGEALSTQVMVRDAARSVKPDRTHQAYISRVAKAGRRLMQALTTRSVQQSTGLLPRTNLRPLLRPEGMPTVVRPDTRSPLLRHVLLPAMERVSGPSQAQARRASPGESSMPPEMLLGAILGDTAINLVEERPELARNLLGQMGGLIDRLDAAGIAPTIEVIKAVGDDLRSQVGGVSDPGDDGGAQPTESEVATDVVSEAVGMPVKSEGDPMAGMEGVDGAVDAVAAEMELEGEVLKTSLIDRISPYVEIDPSTRVFSGKLASLALQEMGALGASIGQDIYIHQKVLAKGGVEAAAVLGHEAVHVQRSRLGMASVESEEEAAYQVESEIRASFDLALEQPPDGGPGTAGEEPGESEAKEAKSDMIINELVDAVATLWERDIWEMNNR